MKKIILVILTFTFGLSVSAQISFEKIDSVGKSKSQIYSDTKMYIAEYWKSSRDVIQNDDKESGIILVKGTTKVIASGTLGVKLDFVYSYSVKFLMKDNKFKILIDNLNCVSGPGDAWENRFKYLVPLDEFPGFGRSGISEKSWLKLISTLKDEMNKIISNYSIFIKKANANEF